MIWILKHLVAVLAFIICTWDASAQSIDQLAWMSGYWFSNNNGVSTEELWSKPAGNLMVGFHRDTFANGRTFFEYLRIEQTDSSIVYLASPQGAVSTPFTLVKLEKQRVIFENLTHDFPQRIIYSRNDNSITARIENAEGSKSREWIWKLTPFDQ